MARDKRKWIYIAQIRASHFEPEVIEELRRRAAAHNTSITEEIVRVVTGSIGGHAVAVRRELARRCRNCDNTGFDATEADGLCHVLNCPRDARAALKAPRAPPSIGNMSKNAEKLVGEVQRLVDDDHEAVRDTEGWLKQHARFDRASRKARSEGWDDLSDWIDAQRRRLAVQREDKRAWRTLARNCPPSMDPVDWAVSLLDRGDPTKMFGILPDEIQQAARQRRSAQSWEPGTRSTNLPYFGRVTVTVHQHSDRKAQRPRNQFSTVVEWTNSQGERAAAEFDPFEQQDRAERFRLKRGTPMPELLQYEVTKLYQGQVPLPPVDPEINEGNKLDWLPYSYQR